MPDAPRAEPPLWSSLAVAASYGGAVRGGTFWHGPGVILAVDEPRWLADPDVWLDARWVFPQASDQPNNFAQTISARAGVSGRVSAHARLGLGFGVDREVTSMSSTRVSIDPRLAPMHFPPNWQPAARVFGRLFSGAWHGFAASATVFADAVHSPDPQNTFRAGLTIEGWWRSRGD